MDFNPHTREGCDKTSTSRPTVMVDFNPHTREGCDRQPLDQPMQHQDFNPHTREGCDELSPCVDRKRVKISIHTPARGVTFRPRYVAVNEFMISIHTPARGVTIITIIRGN